MSKTWGYIMNIPRAKKMEKEKIENKKKEKIRRKKLVEAYHAKLKELYLDEYGIQFKYPYRTEEEYIRHNTRSYYYD